MFVRINPSHHLPCSPLHHLHGHVTISHAAEETRVSNAASVQGLIGVIDLRAVTTCVAQPGGGFTLITPSRTYQLRAETVALARGWTEACQAVVARRTPVP